MLVEKLDIPMKTVVDTVHLNIKAKLIFIDFEGLSDGDSVKKILANIKPRNLVIRIIYRDGHSSIITYR